MFQYELYLLHEKQPIDLSRLPKWSKKKRLKHENQLQGCVCGVTVCAIMCMSETVREHELLNHPFLSSGHSRHYDM